MKNILIMTAALLVPGAALASDLPARVSPPPPAPYFAPAPVLSWTGFYVGLNGGGGWGRATDTSRNVNYFDAAGASYTDNLEGGLAGGQIGYNFQFGGLVLGIEGSADWSGLKGGNDFPQYSSTTTTSVRDLYMVSGRIGFALDRLLVYGKGGYAGSDVRVAQDYYGAAGPRSFANSAFHNGWQVGMGLEYAVTNHVSFGGEWTHVDVGSKAHDGVDSAGVTTQMSAKIREDLLLAKVNYRF